MAYNAMIDYIKKKRIKIDTVVLGGDILDFESVSSYLHNPENWNTSKEIALLDNFLKKIDRDIKPRDIKYIEGNHEDRLRRYIITKAPSLYGLFDLKEYVNKHGIEYINNWELMTAGKLPFKIGKLYILHGHELQIGGSKNLAERIFNRTYENVMCGHWHRTDEFYIRTLSNKERGVWVVGCMGTTYVSYRPITGWNTGFAIIDFEDNGNFIVKNFKVIEGVVR
jgi:hypothetical protein